MLAITSAATAQQYASVRPSLLTIQPEGDAASIDDPSTPPGQPADDARAIQPVPGPPQGVSFVLDADAAHSFSAGIDGTDGSVSSTLVGARLTMRAPINRRLGLNVSVGGGALFYEFSGPSGLLPGDESPWETIEVASVGFGVSYALTRQWRTFGSFNISSAGETGTSFDETWTVGGTIALAYAFSDRLIVGAGVTMQTRLDDNIFVIGFPSIDWTIDEARKWRLVVGGARIGPSRAVGATISYAPNDKVTLIGGWAGLGLGGDFRLDDEGSAPGGIGRDRSFPFLFGIDYKPTPKVTLNAFAGIALFGELELLDSNGNRIAERDVDPQVTLGARVSWSF